MKITLIILLLILGFLVGAQLDSMHKLEVENQNLNQALGAAIWDQQRLKEANKHNWDMAMSMAAANASTADQCVVELGLIDRDLMRGNHETRAKEVEH